jgi:nifR3 family TIM-barrel protein
MTGPSTTASPLDLATRVRHGALLAPMSGVTDVDFRREAARFGATLVVSEMVASDDYVRGVSETRLRAEGEGVAPHVVQLAGCEARWMGEAARLAEAAGAHAIDINMGCPAKRVTNGWSGSALMRDLDHACGLIAATVSAVSVPVTLKMRLGWDHASLNAPELARRAEELGIRMVTVHGRTRQQFYKGAADWSLIRPVREATRLPLVVNGDIGSVASARAALAASGADAVMIGRASLGRPWLPGMIAAELAGRPAAPPPPGTMGEAAASHHVRLLVRMGRDIGLRHARKHVAAYLDEAARLGSPSAARRRALLVVSDDPDAVARGLSEAFLDIPAAASAAA